MHSKERRRGVVNKVIASATDPRNKVLHMHAIRVNTNCVLTKNRTLPPQAALATMPYGFCTNKTIKEQALFNCNGTFLHRSSNNMSGTTYSASLSLFDFMKLTEDSDLLQAQTIFTQAWEEACAKTKSFECVCHFQWPVDEPIKITQDDISIMVTCKFGEALLCCEPV